jgi:hypothetical protein
MTRTFALLTSATIILGSLAPVPPADTAMRCFGQVRFTVIAAIYGYGPGYASMPTAAYPYRPGHPCEFDRQLSGRD